MVDTKAEKDCDVLVGFKAVYRINFAVAIFFFAFFLLMLKVKTSKDPRAAVHNGYVRLSFNVCGSSPSADNMPLEWRQWNTYSVVRWTHEQLFIVIIFYNFLNFYFKVPCKIGQAQCLDIVCFLHS
jgi:hypothetical protein